MSHQFFAACHKPFAEAFVAAYLFQYHRTADIFAQTRFDKVFCLRIFEISPEVGDYARRILNVNCGITELREGKRELRVDGLRPRIIVFEVHGVPLSVVIERTYVVRVLDAFVIPADAVIAHKGILSTRS